jgi:thiamine pyrophosphate-dependent acetolactate synthase large subunit-like protein
MATEQAQAPDADAESGAAHGGRWVARAMRSRGASKLFSLSGGHLFSIYDGCKEEGIEVVDFRHEQSAAFAAIGWAKATREPGICALTAGCGVTNGMSAIATARADGVPLVTLGGRAPELRWGMGSLQEIDHLPFVRPLVKSAQTVKDPAKIARTTAEAIDTAAEPPLGPTFVDYPLDVVFSEAESEVPDAAAVREKVPHGVEQAARLLAEAGRPAIMAGTNLYWAQAESELRELAEALGIPVFLNGLARGCFPPDHELYFSRARGSALQGCDVALVIGVPLDFRLGFGGSFGEESKLIQLDFAPSRLERTRQPDLALAGGIGAALTAIRDSVPADPQRTAAWVNRLRKIEDEKRAEEQEALDASPDARLPRARRLPRSRRDRDWRRRGFRQLRRSGLGDVGARHLDGSRSVRLPWRRPGTGHRRQAGPPRAAGVPAARGRRLRLLRNGVRHDGAAQPPHRRRDGKQRDLGA